MGFETLAVLRKCVPLSLQVIQTLHIRRLRVLTIGADMPRIPQAYEWADAYRPSFGRTLLDMSQGVPGVPPPQILLDALAAASAAPSSCGYLPNEGEPALRTAMAQEMKARYGPDADVTEQDVAITAGCNLAFVAVAIALADAGDEVILPVPW